MLLELYEILFSAAYLKELKQLTEEATEDDDLLWKFPASCILGGCFTTTEAFNTTTYRHAGRFF